MQQPPREKDEPLTKEIPIGAAVFTADGKELGKVKKLESNAFQLDAPRQIDYWLEIALARAISDTKVELSVAEADLGGYKMDRPNDHNAFREAPPESLDPANVRGQQLRRHI